MPARDQLRIDPLAGSLVREVAARGNGRVCERLDHAERIVEFVVEHDIEHDVGGEHDL